MAIGDPDGSPCHRGEPACLAAVITEMEVRLPELGCDHRAPFAFTYLEMTRGADGAMTGYAFPDLLADVVRLQQAGQRDQAHDLFDAHLPLMRYEQQPGPGLAVRKNILMRRGAIRCDAQRTPGSKLTNTARAEVDYLLRRLARHDKRAAGLAAD